METDGHARPRTSGRSFPNGDEPRLPLTCPSLLPRPPRQLRPSSQAPQPLPVESTHSGDLERSWGPASRTAGKGEELGGTRGDPGDQVAVMPSPGRLDSRMRGESMGEGGRSSSLAVPIHKEDSSRGALVARRLRGVLLSTTLLYL